MNVLLVILTLIPGIVFDGQIKVKPHKPGYAALTIQFTVESEKLFDETTYETVWVVGYDKNDKQVATFAYRVKPGEYKKNEIMTINQYYKIYRWKFSNDHLKKLMEKTRKLQEENERSQERIDQQKEEAIELLKKTLIGLGEKMDKEIERREKEIEEIKERGK